MGLGKKLKKAFSKKKKNKPGPIDPFTNGGGVDNPLYQYTPVAQENETPFLSEASTDRHGPDGNGGANEGSFKPQASASKSWSSLLAGLGPGGGGTSASAEMAIDPGRIANAVASTASSAKEASTDRYSSDGNGDKAKARTTKRGHGKDQLRGRHVGTKKLDADDKSDSAHEVQRIDYKRQIGESGTNEGFFKPEDKLHKSWMALDAGIGTEGNVTKDSTEKAVDPRLIARSLASTRLNRALGQDTLAEEVQARHDGRWGVTSAKTDGRSISAATDDVDFANPETQRTTQNLQFMDYLTGQVDRHEGNLFVDESTGRVKGIDNDLAFGTNNDKLGMNNMGLPSHVDKGMADTFAELSEDAFRALIGGQKGDHNKLTSEEVEAAVERFDKLKKLVAGEEVDGQTTKIVETWDDSTFEELTTSLKGDDGADRKMTGFSSDNNANNLLDRSLYWKKVHEQKAAKA